MSNETLADRLIDLRTKIPADVQLIAVSKTKPASMIQELYQAGQRAFGENKVQEMVDKYEQLPKDIQWHLIGHLQTNKVKYIAPFVHLIHAVDSLKLLQEIDKQAAKNNRIIPCLLQFHIANEDTKFGLDFSEAEEILQSREFIEMQNIQIVGLMGMATFTENEEQIRDEFRNLNNYFQIIKSHYFKFNPDFKHLSMGMSGDYDMAIEEGSTMVRIGSTLFGSR
ncbi:MAG: YggS family pyridoxal phosphate-dependent enzyme [Fluviicola sp.]|nr:YggS family pyridoxal phosphate-dependent enzyme [Fluviicola sp.]